MLLTAAVVPGPPACVAELMGAAAHELDDLRDAADRAVFGVLSDLVTAESASPSSDSRPAGSRPLIDLEQGRIIEDEEIKAQLAGEEPYEEWLAPLCN